MTKQQQNDGGPAFPSADAVHPNGQVQYGSFGMSLRDWFAGMAMQAVVGSISWKPNCVNKENPTEKRYAQQAYRFADAMIAEREEGKQS